MFLMEFYTKDRHNFGFKKFLSQMFKQHPISATNSKGSTKNSFLSY